MRHDAAAASGLANQKYERDHAYGHDREQVETQFNDNRERLEEFRSTLPQVRRALANIATYTICDDHEVTGLAALLFGMGWLTARPSLLATYHYNQSVIAATHLFVLGWICTVVMGSMYQLVPVALETRLYSERLAAVQFVCHVVGFIGMVASCFLLWRSPPW